LSSAHDETYSRKLSCFYYIHSNVNSISEALQMFTINAKRRQDFLELVMPHTKDIHGYKAIYLVHSMGCVKKYIAALKSKGLYFIRHTHNKSEM
jgi:hypothetical protein